MHQFASIARTISYFRKKAVHISPISGLNIRGTRDTTQCTRIFPTGTSKVFNVENKIVYWQDIMGGFLIPEMEGLVEVLRTEGYYKENVYVPCSNGETLMDFPETWTRLLEEQALELRHKKKSFENAENIARNNSKTELERREAFLNKCFEISKQKDLEPLPEKFLKNSCFELPISGINVVCWNQTYRLFPVTYSGEAYSLIGTYAVSEGLLAFVDHYGRVFVTTSKLGYKVVTEAGFTEAKWYVPFSRKDELPNSILERCKWEQILGTEA